MSIIYEALKKIETSKSPVSDKGQVFPKIKFSENPDSKERPAMARLVNRKVRSRKLPVKIGLAVCLLLFLTIGFVFYNHAHKPATASVAAEAASPKPPSPPLKLKQPIPANTAPGDLVLQGIVYDKKVPLAIIKGRVHHQYEHIGDYMITEISAKEVTLHNLKNGKTLYLALPF